MSEALRIFAHRGANSIAPENTLAAIALTEDTGTNWFEFDVGCLKDGTLVVIHDDTVDRTTNGTGHLNDLTVDEVRRLDAGSWFSDQYKDEPLPLLSEVIDISNDLGLKMNLEMKGLKATDQRRRKFVADVLKEIGKLKDTSGLIISSFDHGLLEFIEDTSPEIAKGYLIEVWELVDPKISWLTDAVRLHCTAIHPPIEELTQELVKTMRSTGLDVNVWTVNDAETACRIREWGVTGIFTDEAKRMVAELA